MMRIFSLLSVAALLMLCAPAIAMEQSDIPPSPIVKTELILDVLPEDASHARVGVRFTMPEHWHIYWQNPGDSGIPTTLEWKLPKGISAGPIEWPVPEAISTSGLVNYGYSREVTLASTLTGAHPTGEISVTAKWLVCKEICIPESATLRGTLPNSTPAAQLALRQRQLPWGGDATLAGFYADDDNVTFTISAGIPYKTLKTARWFPVVDGIIKNAEPQKFSKEKGDKKGNYSTITLKTVRGSAPLPSTMQGLLVYDTDSGTDATYVTADPSPAPAAPKTSLLSALLLAFLGGLILNIMPCVLPILALKALAIAKKADASRTSAAKHGLAYTVGVVLSFLVIAGVMLALKSAGSAIGWGFQLQNATFVAVLAFVMLLVAANLLGLFELPVLFGERATGVDDNKLSGSLLTGVLAVAVATPCTAPFMATAVGATLAFPTLQALFVFCALGMGMAAPFLLISLWPAARRLLPKPGAWMKRFKQWLALPMLATAAWLIWVFVQLQSPAPMKTDISHETYSAERLAALQKAGTPVLVDATADWCLTCKINERVALTPPSMQEFLREHHVVLMVADWTANDPEITRYLASFNRNGVPLYVYYPPRGKPIVLPQLLTPIIVKDAVLAQPNTDVTPH